MGEDDPDPVDDHPSLEYIEDPYYPKLEYGATPSLDEITEFDHRSYDSDVTGTDGCDWSDETEYYLRSLTLEQILGPSDELDLDPLELQTVETEFQPITNTTNRSKTLRLRLFTRKAMRDVKVTFIDFSKPYLARISSNDNYKKFLNMSGSFFYDATFHFIKLMLTYLSR